MHCMVHMVTCLFVCNRHIQLSNPVDHQIYITHGKLLKENDCGANFILQSLEKKGYQIGLTEQVNTRWRSCTISPYSLCTMSVCLSFSLSAYLAV